MSNRAATQPEGWLSFSGTSYLSDTLDTYSGIRFEFRAHTGASGSFFRHTSNTEYFLEAEETGGTLSFTASVRGVAGMLQSKTYKGITLDEWHTVLWAPDDHLFEIDDEDLGFDLTPASVRAVPVSFFTGLTNVDIGVFTKWDRFTNETYSPNRNFVPQSDGTYYDTVHTEYFQVLGDTPSYYTPETDPWGGDPDPGPDPGPDTGDTGTTGWLTFSPSAGTGSGVITVSADSSTDTAQRSKALRIVGENGTVIYVTVVQEGVPADFLLSPDELNFLDIGGTSEVEVYSTYGWVASAPEWITLSTLDSGQTGNMITGPSGTTTIEVTVGENAGKRNGSVVFTHELETLGSLQVYQSYVDAYLTLDSPNIQVPASGGTIKNGVNSNTKWSGTENKDYLRLSLSPDDTGTTAGLSGISGSSGHTPIYLIFGPNDEYEGRDGYVSFNCLGGTEPVLLNFTQAGVSIPFTVSPESLSFDHTGGTQTLSVSSNVEWTAEAPDWVELSASSGTSGETQITVSTENYTGDTALNGSIVFKYNNSVVATVSVSQEMTEAYLWIINNGTADTQITFTDDTSQVNIEYSDDSINWNSDNTITPGQKKYIRGDITASTKNVNAEVSLLLGPNNNCTIGGSLSSVSVNYPDYLGHKGGRCYRSFFRDSRVTDCQALLLDTNIPDFNPKRGLPFYRYFFRDCINLIIPPEFPPLEVKQDCFKAMFKGCTSLTTAPELPYTTLADSCYASMFEGCTSLTTAPELPATTLVQDCYWDMFSGCTSLTTAPELPATTVAAYCYYQMFKGCTSLTTAPELPATTVAPYCYTGMFAGCTSLTTAPELPATTLVINCYNGMFSGCTSLNYLKMDALEIVDITNPDYMLSGVAPTGTLVVPSAATYSDEDLREWTGMPSGWTIQRQ